MKLELDFFIRFVIFSPMNSNNSPAATLPIKLFLGIYIFLPGALVVPSCAQDTNQVSETTNQIPILQIKADQVTAHVSPTLYGLMTEEINYSYEGGLYGELVRNRTFKADPTKALYWQLVTNEDSEAVMSLDAEQPLNKTLATSLKLEIKKAGQNQSVGIANDGFWGIPVSPKTTYHASFYAKGKNFTGPLTVAIVGKDGKNIFASADVPKISKSWKRYEVTLTTGEVAPTADARLVISAAKSGTVWFNVVSLFPPTYNNRPNGNRPDIMQLLADMQPKFLRFPGGNYLEGNVISNRFDWKKTIGDISQRPGHRDDGWGYWSTDGMGLLEFLEWCEDLNAQPVLAVYAGFSLRQQRVTPGPDLKPYVQDALDEIEYVTGDVKTKWGSVRAKNGHPEPFKLEYVEIGNEDNFDRARTYGLRFAQFADAIKAKYPKLQVIATTKVTNREPDVIDEHFYRSSLQMQSDAGHYDKRPRTGQKVFVGEWATREGSPTPNMNAALGDAAWMTGMERNSDIVIMSCYAPLFVNVSELTGPGRSMQWKTDLIGYDTLNSYGSPAYYAQKMFSANHGDTVLPVTAQNIPMREYQQTNAAAPARLVPALFYVATRDSRTGMIYLKVVNGGPAPQSLRVQISGVNKIESSAEAVTLSAAGPDDTNSIQEPVKIIPVTTTVDGVSADFTREFPPYSITVLRIKED